MICFECDSEVAHKNGCSLDRPAADDPRRVMWLSFMDDTYLAGVFRWLKARHIKWLIVNDGKDLWLSRDAEVWEVPDGSWIVESDSGLAVETPSVGLVEGTQGGEKT